MNQHLVMINMLVLAFLGIGMGAWVSWLYDQLRDRKRELNLWQKYHANLKDKIDRIEEIINGCDD